MRGTTRFQSDPGRCQPVEELLHLAAPKLTPDNRLLVLIDAVHLKNMLGGIQTNSDNRHETAPLAALHTSQPGTTDAVGGRPPQHHNFRRMEPVNPCPLAGRIQLCTDNVAIKNPVFSPSNSMLGGGRTTPQDYPEWSGFG